MQEKTPKGLIGLQLWLCVDVPTKGERDEACDGQAVTSSGGQKNRLKAASGQKVHFHSQQKNRGDEED